MQATGPVYGLRAPELGAAILSFKWRLGNFSTPGSRVLMICDC
jgi:hypothetical protein